MGKKQIIATRTDGPLNYLQVGMQDHVPHWKRFGSGFAQVEFTTHDNAGWISIDTTERSEGGKSSKRTMVTLDPEAGRKLYERLKAMYEPKTI